MTRHFLRDDDLSPAEQAEVLALAKKLKADRHAARPFEGPRAVGIIFDKPTLRTQASFTAGVAELGGYPMLVDGTLARIGSRESVADTARVIGRQATAVVWRTFDQSRIEEMAAYAGVPVVNALTDAFHPCQLLADLQTIEEHKGTLAGLTVAFLGDAASNMSHSFLLACATAGKLNADVERLLARFTKASVPFFEKEVHDLALFERDMADGSVVVIPGADYNTFLTHADLVEEEIRLFLKSH